MEGRGEGEERGQSLTFSSRVRSFENRIFDRITFFFFSFFFKRVVRFAHFSVEIARRDRCTRRCTR